LEYGPDSDKIMEGRLAAVQEYQKSYRTLNPLKAPTPA
jgi:hypothetical protein